MGTDNRRSLQSGELVGALLLVEQKRIKEWLLKIRN